MRDKDAQLIAEGLEEAGFDFAITLPATQIHTLQKRLGDDESFTHVAVANEGEGVAICAGAWLGGKMPVAIMETSGLLVSTYALLRCHATFGIPTLLLSTYRGGLGEQEWYAVHTGASLQKLLETVRVPAKVVDDLDDIKATILEARRSMDASMHPVAIVLGPRVTDRE